MATKTEKFGSVDELIAVDASNASIADMEKEIAALVDADVASEKEATDAKTAKEDARMVAESEARALELDRINKTPGTSERITKLCILGATAKKLIGSSDTINAAVDAEIAKIKDRYDVDRIKADKMTAHALHMVRENLDLLKEDYPLIAGDCVKGIVADRLNPKKAKKGTGSRIAQVDLVDGQEVFMSFKGHNFRSKATATGIMLYGKDVANSTAANALADEYEPKTDGKSNNLGAVYWKASSKTGVEYIDVSK